MWGRVLSAFYFPSSDMLASKQYGHFTTAHIRECALCQPTQCLFGKGQQDSLVMIGQHIVNSLKCTIVNRPCPKWLNRHLVVFRAPSSIWRMLSHSTGSTAFYWHAASEKIFHLTDLPTKKLTLQMIMFHCSLFPDVYMNDIVCSICSQELVKVFTSLHGWYT